MLRFGMFYLTSSGATREEKHCVLTISKRSSFPYPYLRALRAKLKKARKQEIPIAQLDSENGGLIEFSVVSGDHKISLDKLRWRRKKIVKLADFSDSSRRSMGPGEVKVDNPVCRHSISSAVERNIV
jgi:hypothetical protein